MSLRAHKVGSVNSRCPSQLLILPRLHVGGPKFILVQKYCPMAQYDYSQRKSGTSERQFGDLLNRTLEAFRVKWLRVATLPEPHCPTIR